MMALERSQLDPLTAGRLLLRLRTTQVLLSSDMLEPFCP